MNWGRVALMVFMPLPIAVAAAYPFWRHREVIFGNIVGAAVIFGVAVALVINESFELDRLIRNCLDAGLTCWPEPSAFTRYVVYASIGLVEVVALFTASLMVEKRVRNRGYSPEWRS